MAAKPTRELDEQLEVAAGRRAPYTQVPDWVALSGISNHAKALYWHLAMHINQQRGDFEVWPTRYTLAAWCGFKKDDSLDPYLNELIALNAIEKYTRRYSQGMRQRNVYVIHQEPPEDYTGPRSLQEFYAARKASSVELGGKFGNEFSKTPGHTEPRCNGVPVAPHSEVREVRHTGVPEVRHSGVKPDEVKPDELPTPSPQPPNSTAAADSAPSTEGEGEGGGATSANTPNEVWDMLADIPLPEGKRAPGRRSAKLAEAAARCTAILADAEHYGLTLADLQRHLAADLDTVRHSIVGCWLHRLADEQLPYPPAARPDPQRGSRSVPPVCGQCDAREGDPVNQRIVDVTDADGNTRTAKCPRCNPHAKGVSVGAEHA